MEWLSKNVPQGGMFHTAKAQYSPETKNFLKLLIDESRLTDWQRSKINYSLRSGDPLPPIQALAEQKSRHGHVKIPPVTVRPGSSKRRMRSTIVQSGAYERERFVPDRTKVDRAVLKEELQRTMAEGKTGRRKFQRQKTIEPKVDRESATNLNRFDELMKEIQERQDWLKEMEELGEAYKHRDVINLQIEEKLREMEKLRSGVSMADGKKSEKQ